MIFDVPEVACVVDGRLSVALLNTAKAYPVPDSFARNILPDLPYPRPRSSLRLSQQGAGESFKEEGFILFSTFRKGESGSRHFYSRWRRRRGGGGVASVGGGRILHFSEARR